LIGMPHKAPHKAKHTRAVEEGMEQETSL